MEMLTFFNWSHFPQMHETAFFVPFYAYIARIRVCKRAHKRRNHKNRREGQKRTVSRLRSRSRMFLVVNREGRIASNRLFSAKRGFIFRRFTMLYGVGLAASTNNCQLNVPRIDRPCCQLRENSGYPSIKGPPILIFFFINLWYTSSINILLAHEYETWYSRAYFWHLGFLYFPSLY